MSGQSEENRNSEIPMEPANPAGSAKAPNGEKRKNAALAVRWVLCLALCAVAAICFLIGMQQLRQAAERENSDRYLAVYRENYRAREEDYHDMVAKAQYYGSGNFYNSYMDLAQSYREMMDDNQQKIDAILGEINGQRRGAMVLGGVSAASLAAGVALLLWHARKPLLIAGIAVAAAVGGVLIVKGAREMRAAGVGNASQSVYRYVSPAAVATSEPRTGKEGALALARRYLSSGASSREGLIKLLQNNGFSSSEASYAVNACGADWNAQAVQKTQEYLKYTTVSRQAAIRLLVQDGFTESEAIYGVDHSAADWYAQAVKAAKEYLSVSVSSYDQMIRLLVTGGFTEDQASYGAAHCGKKW